MELRQFESSGESVFFRDSRPIILPFNDFSSNYRYISIEFDLGLQQVINRSAVCLSAREVIDRVTGPTGSLPEGTSTALLPLVLLVGVGLIRRISFFPGPYNQILISIFNN